MRAREMGLAALLVVAVPVGCATIAEVGEPGDYVVVGAGGAGGAGGGQACTGAGVGEGCPCLDGPPEICYSGPAGTLDVGACKAGTVTCADGVWGPCAGEILPVDETCNGVDDDCDGEVDEGDLGTGEDCKADALGECQRGTKQCVSGALTCVSNLQPEPESCDGKDNDCDGQADEDNPQGGLSCSTNYLGDCAKGKSRCTDGTLFCDQLVYPTAELCTENNDEDCDGANGEEHYGYSFSSVGLWKFTGEWAIAKAAGGGPCGDPSDDATNTIDGMLAGVTVGKSGGCVPPGKGELTSPMMSMSKLAGGQVWLKYKRRLQTSSIMTNTIQVRDNVSSGWTSIWTSEGDSINDPNWESQSIDLTKLISAGAEWFQLQWTYNNKGASADLGGWSIDDVQILDDDCK